MRRGGGDGANAAREELVRVLPQLMHVHDVGDAAELVDRGEGAAALDARLDVCEKQDRDPEEHHVLDRLG